MFEAENVDRESDEENVVFIAGLERPHSDLKGHKLTGPNGGTTLSAPQAAFAREYVANRGNGDKARIAAGYRASSMVQKLLMNPCVLAEIRRLAVYDVEARLPQLIQRQIDIALNPETKPELASKLIFGLMDRAGMRPRSEPTPQIINNTTNIDARQVTLTPQEILRQLDEARTKRLSGTSASVSDNPPQYDPPPADARVIAPGRPKGGGVDQGPSPGPVPIPTPSDTQNGSEA